MQEQVFINCVPEDLPLLEGIKKRLELAGLPVYVPPAALDPVIQNEMVEKIKGIAAVHGCMLCILSNRAVTNSLFISNIQLMCESARTGRVLVHYQVEPLENDQNIRLFASQAFQVKGSGHPAEDTSKIIRRIHQVLHPPSRNIFQFLSQQLSRKAIIRLFIAALILGVIGSIWFNARKPAPVAPLLSTPTAVVLYDPFSGQSQDAGLTVDARYVPDYRQETDPALEAPFTFQPATILERQDFNDPTFEHTYDGKKWFFSYMLDDMSSIAVNQTNGVLQLAVAPVGDQQLTLDLNSKYLFNLEQLPYLGYRFRLDNYQGMITDNTIFNCVFFSAPGEALSDPNFGFDGISQMLSDNPDIFLGSRWHTVEMLSQVDKHFVDIYLDGKKIRTVSFNDQQLLLWRRYAFNLYVSNTSDWVRIQIDEVIFGADQPLAKTLLPEEAPYRFTPDMSDLHEDFGSGAYQQALVLGGEYVTQSGGVLSFLFPPGKDDPSIRLQFPGKPVNENNYYAARFRFTSPDDNYWANWAGLYIGLENQNFQSPQGYSLYLGTLRRELHFQGNSGKNDGANAPAYNQNAQPGNWHTLEMIIKPPEGGSQAYTVFYWVDGYLLGKSILQDPDNFSDANAPLLATINIFGGSYRQEVFSGEIDDLVIGTIASDKIKE